MSEAALITTTGGVTASLPHHNLTPPLPPHSARRTRSGSSATSGTMASVWLSCHHTAPFAKALRRYVTCWCTALNGTVASPYSGAHRGKGSYLHPHVKLVYGSRGS